MKNLTVVLFLILCLTSCVPGGFRPGEAAGLFDLTVDGKATTPAADFFVYTGEEFTLSVTLFYEHLEFTFDNKTSEPVRLLWDESVFVFADGSTSRVLSSNASWATRNDPQPPAIAPSGAKISDALFPLNTAYFEDGVKFTPLFPALTNTKLSVILAFEIAGQKRETTLVFTSKS